jgi:two-component system chemotaxis response regulator CheV
LAKCLELPENPITGEDRLILIGKDDQNIAFHVDSVAGIHNIANTDIMEPDEAITTSLKEAVTGVLNTGNKQIEILDIDVINNYINSSLAI